jgi:hypothetical protein
MIAAGCVGLAAVAAAGAWLALRDRAEPVDVEEALTSFRGETTGASGESPIPEGVYVYATEGYEETDALTGVTHRYPSRSTLTVAAADCGVRLTWRVLKGRSTAWTYCVSDDGWELRSQDERHTFFGRTEPTTYRCTSTFIRPIAAPAAPRAAPVDCRTDDTTEEGHVVALGSPNVRVRNDVRRTIHVRKSTTFRGASRGSAEHDLWFDARSGLPVRLILASRTTSDSPIGDVDYEEHVTLDLLSLEPRR